MSRRTLTRVGWYAAAASVPATALLLAFGGGDFNTFMFWFLLFGFTAVGTGRVYIWWVGRNSRQGPAEIAEVPIDYGVGTQPAAFTLTPDFGVHTANCTRCKHQAHGISAA